MNPIYAEGCVIGLGPAGLGAALRFARSPVARRVICLEAGVAADSKFCSILQGKGCRRVEPCQIITGVGGASLLSGGKVSVFPAGRVMANLIGGESEARQSLQKALGLFQEFVPLIRPQFLDAAIEEASAQYIHRGFEFRYYDSYLYRQTDLVAGYNRMLAEISDTGVRVYLGTRVTQVTATKEVFRLFGYSGDTEVEFLCRWLMLGIGRFGTTLLDSIDAPLGLEGQPNHCDIGIRLEFPTSVWPDINRCHNDLKLHFGKARTFCVCKDGQLAPYRLGDIFLVEGHADPGMSTGFTNLAITIRQPSNNGIDQHILFSDIRHRLLAQTGGRPVRQRLTDFLAERPSLKRGTDEPASISYWKWGDANACFPRDVGTEVREAVKYFACRLLPTDAYPSISVFAPELDYFWQKFPLEKGFRSRKPSLYLIGECSGHFRGILQAFASGVECAEHIVGADHVS